MNLNSSFAVVVQKILQTKISVHLYKLVLNDKLATTDQFQSFQLKASGFLTQR